MGHGRTVRRALRASGQSPAVRSQATGIALAVVMAVGLPATATSAQEGPPPYPPGRAQVACDQTAARPGDPPFCAAGGFAPGSEVMVTLAGPLSEGAAATRTAVLASIALPLVAQGGAPVVADEAITADAEGVARTTVPLPAGTRPGTYRLAFAGFAPDGTAHEVVTEIRVLPAANLSATGAGVTRWLAVVAVLVIAGALLVFGTRQRDHSGRAAAGDRSGAASSD